MDQEYQDRCENLSRLWLKFKVPLAKEQRNTHNNEYIYRGADAIEYYVGRHICRTIWMYIDNSYKAEVLDRCLAPYHLGSYDDRCESFKLYLYMREQLHKYERKERSEKTRLNQMIRSLFTKNMIN